MTGKPEVETDETDYFRVADQPEVGQTSQCKDVSHYKFGLARLAEKNHLDCSSSAR